MDKEDRDAQEGRDDAELQLVRRRDDPHAQVGERQQRRPADRRGQQDRRRAAVGQRTDQMRHDQPDETDRPRCLPTVTESARKRGGDTGIYAGVRTRYATVTNIICRKGFLQVVSL